MPAFAAVKLIKDARRAESNLESVVENGAASGQLIGRFFSAENSPMAMARRTKGDTRH